MEVLGSGSTSPIFGGENQRWAVIGIGIAFLGMSILAFLLFRTFVPSLAIVISAFSDMLVPIAVLNLLGIKLSLGTVAALLMLIGYSVDSDILLTNHVLRRSGGFYESTYRAMRTGVTMTLTSMAALFVMAVTASFFGIDLMASIGLVLIIGLAADLLNTYMLNVSLLRWYKYEGVAR
jgi:preprotein translocase subunit SecF